MKRIFVPTRSGSDWQRLLTKPELHWKSGRSAMTAAACWEAAVDRLPDEVTAALEGSGVPELNDLQLLAALPEWEVPLPGGSRSSFTDVLAITRNNHGLCTIAVEAKAGEDFGPTLADWLLDASPGRSIRLAFLQDLLRTPFPVDIRYQLLHRTASALSIANLFHAPTAVMLVHAWQSTPEQRRDFETFAQIMGAEPCSPAVSVVRRFNAPQLYLAWCEGDPESAQVTLPPGE